MSISIDAQIKEVQQSVTGVNDDPATRKEIQRWVEHDLSSNVHAWLPLAILSHVMPDWTEEFQNPRVPSLDTAPADAPKAHAAALSGRHAAQSIPTKGQSEFCGTVTATEDPSHSPANDRNFVPFIDPTTPEPEFGPLREFN